MTLNATPAHRAPSTERAVALATTAAPVATGVLAPFLDGGAAFTATLAYGGAAGFMIANYMNRLPTAVVENLPAADIVQAHRSPMFFSAVTTGVALGLGTLGGPQGADALMAGILTLPSIPGIVSLGWWAAVGLIPLKLRRVLSRTPKTAVPTVVGMPAPAATEAEDILQRWAQHISNPQSGAHRGQELTLSTHGPTRWTGTITAPAGSSVNVSKKTVSSVYQVPTEWIGFADGAHAGELHITVDRVAPPEIDPSTLAGAWKKYVARPGGLMPGTHLKDVQDDPHTGGQVALVVADENTDKLAVPDRAALAGALRTTPLLVSYEPRHNPREAFIRKMNTNPLEAGAPFPGVHVLKADADGYIIIGKGVSGFPARIQLFDPKMGAQHLLIAGVTGSGKGGTIQIVSLAHHVNGSAILYADPKGSSNPAVEAMSAHSGLTIDGAIGAMRIGYHLLQHRIAESARLGLKNFQASPMRPLAPLILDEASKMLGGNSPYKKEAKFITNAYATQGRSLGMPITLANQIMNLDQLGGEAAIRDNIFYGGALILLRSDSDQKNRVDLPENFAGCNPADIPAVWAEERSMIYDPSTPPNNPERTFGLGFAAGPDGAPEMMRNWILEDATPYIDPAHIAVPEDFPLWDAREELAARSVLPDDQDEDDEFGTTLVGGVDLPKKPVSADDKILKVLEDAADPLALEPIYMHKDQIGELARLEGSTLSNTLSQLVKAGQIHRQMKDGKEVRGMYGLGPAPEAGE